MRSKYQHLNTYNGKLNNELDLEKFDSTPNDFYVGTPGGLSSIHHHYTGGWYGKGNETTDIYAGQGERYPYGNYGGMYNKEFFDNTSINTTPIDNVELVKNPKKRKGINVFLIFLLFLFGFIVFDFWAETGRTFIREKIHGGKNPPFLYILIYALILTGVFLFVLWISDVPLTLFEGNDI